MSLDVINPVAVEARIRELADRIAKSATVCNDRYRDFLDADRAFDKAFARAFLAHEGPQTEKRYAADLATMTEREARDVADSAYRFADRLGKALESELRAWQSIGASVRSMYSVAGRGE